MLRWFCLGDFLGLISRQAWPNGREPTKCLRDWRASGRAGDKLASWPVTAPLPYVRQASPLHVRFSYWLINAPGEDNATQRDNKCHCRRLGEIVR